MEFSARIRIFYALPPPARIVLRTDRDWGRDLEATETSADRTRFDFEVTARRPFLEFKPCVVGERGMRWSEGPNKLAVLSESHRVLDFYPHFHSGNRGEITGVLRVGSRVLGRDLAIRVYLPAGYAENTLKRYPVIYMHDGRNLFFPEESAHGSEWRVDETLDTLDSMSLIDRTIVVGVHAARRMVDYTMPGWEAYGQAIVEELKPWIDDRFRTRRGSQSTAVMGSSLGGVVSFFLAWQWPAVFGNVACLSSSFGYRDDLFERVAKDPMDDRGELKVYLDSGWPGDNYEATRSMANALVERGLQFGRDFLYFAFPGGRHAESAWAARCHLPLQLFAGKVPHASFRARLGAVDALPARDGSGAGG